MNYPNEIMLLMNDIDGDFLDGGHIKRFHILLAEIGRASCRERV